MMKNLRLTKAELLMIEQGIQIDVMLGGFPAYCIKNDYGDFRTPSGVRFEVNFYAPCNLTLKINGKDQSED